MDQEVERIRKSGNEIIEYTDEGRPSHQQQDDEDPHESNFPVLRTHTRRQQRSEDMRAIERRDWNQVKYREDDVERDSPREHP